MFVCRSKACSAEERESLTEYKLGVSIFHSFLRSSQLLMLLDMRGSFSLSGEGTDEERAKKMMKKLILEKASWTLDRAK